MTSASSGARRFGPLVAGVAAVGLGSLVGANPSLADAILNGPILLRAVLAGAVSVPGLWLLLMAVARLAGEDDRAPQRTFGDTIRAIRLVFLAVAAFAAASSFVVGHLLPLVVGLIIAGVDVAETALLLLVAGMHHGDDGAG